MEKKHYVLAAALLVVAAAPLMTGDYMRYVVTLWMIYALASVGLQIPIGLASIYSFGHGVFMLIGAYTTGLGVIHGVPILLAVLGGVALSILVGAMMALPSLRLSGFALAVVTMGAASLFAQGVKAFQLTGTTQGLTLPPVPFVQMAGGRVFYITALLVLVVGATVSRCVDKGPIGRSLRAAATNPLMASSFGVHLLKVRTLAFVLSAVYGALAGSLLGLLIGYIAPEAYSPELSIQLFAAVMIGGSSSYWGPILGALFIVLIPELTQSVQNASAVVYAVLFTVVVTVYPGGLQQLTTTPLAWRGLSRGKR